ncbi:MAG: 5-(carboxyamino)imidazole ribonucleotide synthase [Nitrososphaera sp.]
MPALEEKIDSFSLNRKVRIGIIGGGQLGKMIAAEAKRMAIHVVIIDPSPDCPASGVADEQIVADFKNDEAIRELGRKVDFITFEIELANSKALHELEASGFPVRPRPAALLTIQNKLRQKNFLRQNNIPVTDFAPVKSSEELRQLCDQFGYPLMMKAAEDSYDGRGNFLIRSARQIPDAIDYFGEKECFVEKFVKFRKELSIMVARNPAGQIECFPLAHNIHENSILDTTLAPAGVPPPVARKADLIARRTMAAFGSAGIFGVEMFWSYAGEILVNEVAPRPHNSGHYANEACSVSQFEQHLRCVLNLPLAKPKLLSPAAMVNILGPEGVDGSYSVTGLQKSLAVPQTSLYIYGKSTSRPRRKLGHITALGKTVREASTRASNARAALKIIGIQEAG